MSTCEVKVNFVHFEPNLKFVDRF